MKKLLVLFLVSLLFACANPDTVTLDIPTGIPPVALLPDGGTEPDNGTDPDGGTDRPDRPPIDVPERPNIIRDLNDPWQNLEIGYLTPGNVGIKLEEKFAYLDYTGLGLEGVDSNKYEITSYFHTSNKEDAYYAYRNALMASNGDYVNNGQLFDIKGNAIVKYIENIEEINKPMNVLRQKYFYNMAMDHTGNGNFIRKTPIKKTTIRVDYDPGDGNHSYVYYFKMLNDGWGRLELVGRGVYSNGRHNIEGDLNNDTMYIPSDIDPRWG